MAKVRNYPEERRKRNERARFLGYTSHDAMTKANRAYIQKEYQQASDNGRAPQAFGSWSARKKMKWAAAHKAAVDTIRNPTGAWLSFWHTLYVVVEESMTDAEFRERYPTD